MVLENAMNKLNLDKRTTVISALVEGCSIRSTERMTGVHRDTIMRLMIRVGDVCALFMDHEMRDLTCRHLQMDEIWCYVGKKQRHLKPSDDPAQNGDFWTYVALDTNSKLVPAYRVGKRDGANTRAFVSDLASRLDGRVQLSSDALEAYVDAVEQGFGSDVDYGRIVKHYEATPVGPGRYSPPKVASTTREQIMGTPEHICTSHVERQNLTMRMSMRRFTRLTNAFSKKLDNLKAAVSLHFAHYNFCRIHKTLRVTPAMEAGIANEPLELHDLVAAAN